MEPRNLIGPTIRRLRNQKGWTQQRLASECAVHGWAITRTAIAKIEAGYRGVNDGEIWFLADLLGLPAEVFFHPECESILKNLEPKLLSKRNNSRRKRLEQALKIIRHSGDPDQ